MQDLQQVLRTWGDSSKFNGERGLESIHRGGGGGQGGEGGGMGGLKW